MVDFRIKNLELRIKLFLALFFTAIAGALLILTALFYTRPAFAQTPQPTNPPSPQPLTQSKYNPLHSTDYILASLMSTTSCLGAGISITGQPCLTFSPSANGLIQPALSYYNSGGLLDFTTGVIAMLYINPPVRTMEYLGSVGQNLGLVKEAHAQVVGSGSGVIGIVLSLWQVSRNVAYLVMIIIFVVIGLMVMFRQRINPQTVITAQAALPGLIIGLILITFSYFLAALLVDIAFVGTWLVGYYFQPVTGLNTASVVNTILPNRSVLDLFSQFSNAPNTDQFTHAVGPIIENIQGTARNILNGVLFFLACNYATQFSDPVAKGIASMGVADPRAQLIAGGVNVAACVGGGSWALTNPDSAIGFFIFLVVLFVLLYSMVKLLMKLINNYIVILFLTFTAPFHFLAAALPGRQGVATSWVLNMLCNVLAFPAVFGALYFAAYILGGNVTTTFGTTAGPNFGTQTLPLLSGLSENLIRFLVAFGVLVATPTLPDIICGAIGRVGRAGQLIGQEISEARRAGEQRLGQVGGGLGRIGSTVGEAYAGRRQAILIGKGVATRPRTL